jgi:hypothetical protein
VAPTLDDYWTNAARWKFRDVITPADMGGAGDYVAGAHIEVVGGVWYLFSRKIYENNAACKASGAPLGTEVRRSDDAGATWSAPSPVVVPTDGSPWACDATDGDAYYDPANHTWHYLFQCLAAGGSWNGCHVMKAADDPMGGGFVPSGANPVIPSKSLWSKICNAPTDDCVSLASKPVFDEGTFDIVHAEGSSIWISFHGYDGKNGYRGIARTNDLFSTFVAGDASMGVPVDAIADKLDAASWREAWQGGSIGVGAGSSLRVGSRTYMLIEAADVNLGCTKGQNWDLGLFRTDNLTQTHWDQLPQGNPIAYSSKGSDATPCNPAYGRLFKDDMTGKTYMHYSRIEKLFGILLYELVPNLNQLDNGDLWKCDSTSFKKFSLGPTNLAVYRNPSEATDGNCYLQTNCGAGECQEGQSIYQDAPAAAAHGQHVHYGGKFASFSGDAPLTLALFELDANGAILVGHSTNVTAGPEYKEFDAEADLGTDYATLRYQIYLKSPLTYSADEMYVDLRP